LVVLVSLGRNSEQCNQDTTRPHLEECKRMGDQEEIVEKLYASTSCEVLPTNVAGKPRQGLISKLSLGKGANTLTEREDLTPEMAKDCAVKDPASLFVKKTNAAIQKSFCSTNQTTSESGLCHSALSQAFPKARGYGPGVGHIILT